MIFPLEWFWFLAVTLTGAGVPVSRFHMQFVGYSFVLEILNFIE